MIERILRTPLPRTRIRSLKRLALVVIWVVLTGPLASSADESAKDKLEKAKATYHEEIAKAKAAVMATIDQRVSAAQKAGDLAALKKVQSERSAFVERGQLPKGSGATEYAGAVTKAENRYSAALTAARREFTQAGMIAEAEGADAEIKSLNAQPPAVDNRSLWVFPDKTGYVIKTVDKDWLEKVDNGQGSNCFVEIGRTKEYVELSNVRIDLIMRIYDDRMVVGPRGRVPDWNAGGRRGGRWVNK